MNKSIKYLIPAVMALTLVACGGSSSKSGASYSGKSDPANFSSADTATKTQIGNDSATVISEAIDISDSDGFLGDFPMAATTQDGSKLQSKAQKYINISLAQASQAKAQDSTLSSLPVGASESVTIPCSSGEMVLTINGNDNSENMKMQMTYKNCRQDDSDGDYDLTNGTVIYSVSYSEKSNDSSIKIEFKNLKEEFVWNNGPKETSLINGYYKVTGLNISQDDDDVDFSEAVYTAEWDLTGTDNGKSIASKGSMKCTVNGCTVGTTVKTADGKTYKVEDFEVVTNSQGDPSSAKGTIYHPDHGYYTFTANITDAWCDEDDPSPFAGTATFTDNAGNKIEYSSQACGNEPTIN